MRDSTTHTDPADEARQAAPRAVPGSYEEIYEADDYLAILDAAYGPEETQPALH